ncbi:pyrimidine/purine nucleoside phosphorylase [Tamlana fucoidanivorans]|uniref:Pyrimidine/purine nucleoside phosphorylase n=1 Tax=Allotamlana fucoidanivorans TaxID=2583814 RepID=A0A5C4SMG6_9FLAO|nr:pyrimidine/purine nucleoside phosphorylase [Tamlana fucoidanivorans]TNJ45307.1 pyrimidine/purine nucleoside phosphorylase [Tamlana fucoidanivorans]
MISTNEYFGGQVKSLGYTTTEGKSTIGVMEAGSYEFGTTTHETMTVIEGEMLVQLPESTDWETYQSGESYKIDANKSFKVKVTKQVSYLCQYK